MKFHTLNEDISSLATDEEMIAALQKRFENQHGHSDGSPVKLNIVKPEFKFEPEYALPESIVFGCTCNMIFTESGGHFVSGKHDEYDNRDYGTDYSGF